MSKTHEIRLTQLDSVRLESALMEILRTSQTEPQGAAELEALLDAAAIVPPDTIGPSVITMNSTVVLEARPSGEQTTLTLVYPKDAATEHSRVSVLSPMGRALLGSRVGDLIRVVVPAYGERQFVVAALTFQPEASGRLDL